MKKTEIQKAYECCKEARGKQFELFTQGKSRKMEVLEDKCGVVIERWLVGKTDAILFATPHGWAIYVPITESGETSVTLEALEVLAGVQAVTCD